MAFRDKGIYVDKQVVNSSLPKVSNLDGEFLVRQVKSPEDPLLFARHIAP
jgi:hypothetical protein